VGIKIINSILYDLQSEITRTNNVVNDGEFLVLSKSENDPRDREFLRGLTERGRHELRVYRRIIEMVRQIPVIDYQINIEGGYIYVSDIPIARNEDGIWRLFDSTPIGTTPEEAITYLDGHFLETTKPFLIEKRKVEDEEE
jgi:hypothetical protein